MSIGATLKPDLQALLQSIYGARDYGLELAMLARLFDQGTFASGIATHVQNAVTTVLGAAHGHRFLGVQAWVDKLGYVRNGPFAKATELADAAFAVLDLGVLSQPPLSAAGLVSHLKTCAGLPGRLVLMQAKATNAPNAPPHASWYVPGDAHYSLSGPTGRQHYIYQTWPVFDYAKAPKSKLLLTQVDIQPFVSHRQGQQPECWYMICGKQTSNRALSGEGWDCGPVRVLPAPAKVGACCTLALSELLAGFYEIAIFGSQNTLAVSDSVGRDFIYNPPNRGAAGWNELCSTLIDLALSSGSGSRRFQAPMTMPRHIYQPAMPSGFSSAATGQMLTFATATEAAAEVGDGRRRYPDSGGGQPRFPDRETLPGPRRAMTLLLHYRLPEASIDEISEQGDPSCA